MRYLHNFNNQELQCYPNLLSVYAEQETLVRSVTNKATYTEFTPKFRFTLVLSTMSEIASNTICRPLLGGAVICA